MNYQLNIPIVRGKRKKISILLITLMILLPFIILWQSNMNNKTVVIIFLILYGILFFIMLFRRMIIKDYIEIGNIKANNNNIEVMVDNDIRIFKYDEIKSVVFRYGSTSQDSYGRSLVTSEGIDNYIYFSKNDNGLIQYRIFIKNKTTANYLQIFLKSIYADKYKLTKI